MCAGQIILGYTAKYLGDYSGLSAFLSHTSNSIPLRAGICWPHYLDQVQWGWRNRNLTLQMQM